jgi:predicted transposase YbfD/YdcC
MLTALGVRFDVFTARHVCPDESTIRDLLSRIDAGVLATTGCRYLADLVEGRTKVRTDVPDEREARRARAAATRAVGGDAKPKAYALDGKRLAGARRGDGTRVNLLSLVDHETGLTATQREIPSKTNEIPEARILLSDVDVAGAVLTLDALHTQRDTAEAIVTDHHAAYVLAIKGNQPNLYNAVAARFTQPNSYFQETGQYTTATNTAHSSTCSHRTGQVTNTPGPCVVRGSDVAVWWGQECLNTGSGAGVHQQRQDVGGRGWGDPLLPELSPIDRPVADAATADGLDTPDPRVKIVTVGQDRQRAGRFQPWECVPLLVVPVARAGTDRALA